MSVTTILVIDDEYLTRISLADFLEEAGYRTKAVANGPAALQYQQQQPFDVCIVDIRLPGMDGIETMLALRKISNHSRYIIYTGSPQFSLTPDLEKVGLTGEYILHKPVPDMSIFLTLIQQLTSPTQEK